MKLWRPEHAVVGPESPGEGDLAALNRIFSDAFTDRYRRDGLVGVRVPPLNLQIWRYALRDAGPGAMVWRDEDDQLVAFNIAHRSGLEGWMGPLAVRPDRQGLGLGLASNAGSGGNAYSSGSASSASATVSAHSASSASRRRSLVYVTARRPPLSTRRPRPRLAA